MVLMVYRAGVENVRTLVKIIPVDSKVESIDSNKPFTLSAGGKDTDYIFL
jgi:hypothetical protein